MCRSKRERPEHGKRCPGPKDPRERERRAEARRIRQRMGRNDRAARRAEADGDVERAEGYAALVEHDLEVYAAVRAAAPVPVPRELDTRAADFTPWAAAERSDDELVAAMDTVGADTAAMEQIVATLEYRETQAAGGTLADLVRDRQHRRENGQIPAWDAPGETPRPDSSPLTNPAARKVRKLSTAQRSREEYRAHIYDQYLQAESETNGYLLSPAGKAAGIDPESLFTGPPARAAKYASPELKSWWQRNGRTSYAMWQAQKAGRVDHAATVRAQSYGEAVA